MQDEDELAAREGWRLRGWAIAGLAMGYALARERLASDPAAAGRILAFAREHLDALTVTSAGFVDEAGVRTMIEAARAQLDRLAADLEREAPGRQH